MVLVCEFFLHLMEHKSAELVTMGPAWDPTTADGRLCLANAKKYFEERRAASQLRYDALYTPPTPSIKNYFK